VGQICCAAVALMLQFSPNLATAAEKPAYMKLSWQQVATRMPDDWYGSDEAKAVLEIVLKYQTEIGGWAKNTGYHDEEHVRQDEWARIQQSGVGATFDNGSTLREMRFLAKVYSKTQDERCRDAFLKALDYIFKAQYENGGWPQYFPYRKNKSAYSSHITYNDNVMTSVLRFLKEISEDQSEFAALQLGDQIRQRAAEAFDKGVECILNTQIRVNGKPTVWCAQHDEFTLAPTGARSYELASFSGAESVGVVSLLMELEQPTPEVIVAVQSAIEWFEAHKISGIRVEEIVNADGKKDRVVVEDSSAPALWARFYDLETGKPFFCDRDGIKKDTLAEIGIDRRVGYSWYTTAPAALLRKYPAWAARFVK
jgi:pectinesterase